LTTMKEIAVGKTQLHEILAVEKDLSGQSARIAAETVQLFRNSSKFTGSTTEFLPFDEKDQSLSESQQEAIATTVERRLKYTAAALTKYWDVVLRKEIANQEARADIVVGETVVASDVPATMLLGLESKLRSFRDSIQNMPTLDNKVHWQPAPEIGENISMATSPTETFRTRKVVEPVVLYEAVIKDGVGIPAQVKEVSKDVPWGKTRKQHFSGEVSSARAADILAKTDALIQAVKSARMRANKVEVDTTQKIGQKLFDHILS